MKVVRLFLVLILCLLLNRLVAQNCASFTVLQNNKTITWGNFTKRGDANGSIIFKTSNINQKASAITATVKAEVFDKRHKSINSTVNYVKCENGVLMMDLRFYLPQQQSEQFNRAGAQSKNVYLEYPANMKTGDQLKDGSFDITLDNNGLKQKMDMLISNRVVTGTDNVVTPAGEWNCFVITYQVKINIQTGPIAIPLLFEATEWFSPLFGIVKTENKTGYSQVMAVK